MGAAPGTKRRLPRRRDTRAAQLAAADKAIAAANKLTNDTFTSEYIKPRYVFYHFPSFPNPNRTMTNAHG